MSDRSEEPKRTHGPDIVEEELVYGSQITARTDHVVFCD